MAVDEALLAEADRTGRAFLRLYRFHPPCLSFGRNEPARERYDREAIARVGLDVVRRPTGGRAVWHAHEVTYAVAAPIGAFESGSLRTCYLAIHTRLAIGLRALGVPATLASDGRTAGRTDRPTARPPDRPGPCFAAPVGGEVLIGGQKVIGSAQVRHGTAFLQHGSILLAGSQDVVTAVSREAQAASRTPHAASGATTLSVALGRLVTWDEVTEAIVGVWGDNVTSTAFHRPPPPFTARFSDPAWTWRR
jgi:lipoate-protein ligase A